MKNKKKFCSAFLFMFIATSAAAWRIETPFGDAKGDDPGEIIEDTTETIGEVIRAPGKIPGILWEGVTNPFREIFSQSGYIGLQNWIARSRDDALRAGVAPIPAHIYQKLRAYYPDALLNIVRYRVGASGELALQNSAFNLGDMSAIALDYVIVFRNMQQAQWDDKLWAHEVAHIDQYQRWGIRDFAINYLRDFDGVENEANQRADEYQRVVQQQNIPSAPPQLLSVPPPIISPPRIPVRFCRTGWGTCSIPPTYNPMGSPCYCADRYGNQIYGSAF